MFSLSRYITPLGIGLLIASNQIAGAQVPEIPNNPGVPGLLAEVSRLETELQVTTDELRDTERELAATSEQLSLTEAELELKVESLTKVTAELDTERRTYRVPQTGQKECYDANTLNPDEPHFFTNCAGEGQDGELRAGLAAPAIRFVNNGNGTVLDTFTNLVWLARRDCRNDLSWPEATRFARELNGQPNTNQCSLRDGSAPGLWRLPNVQEIMSVLDWSTRPVGLLLKDPFIQSAGRVFVWTSTTYPVGPSDSVALLYPCLTRGYGQMMWDRFNDAYIVNLFSGELRRAPKERPVDIARRHKVETQLSLCRSDGFRDGAPEGLPQPTFIAVRNMTVEESQK